MAVDLEKFREAVETEREALTQRLRSLNQLADALDALGVMEMTGWRPDVQALKTERAVRKTMPKSNGLTAAGATTREKRSAAVKAKDGETATGQARFAILAYLVKAIPLDPDGGPAGADSAKIREAVAKAVKAKTTDPKFRHDVANALTRMKRDGEVERSGTWWSLTVKGMAAAKA